MASLHLVGAEEHLEFEIKVFALFGFFAICASTSTCAITSHTLPCLSPTLPLLSSLMFSSSSLFATMVCASLSLYCKRGDTVLILASEGGHTAIVELLLGAGADKEAKNKVRERMRERSTHTHMWLTRWCERENTSDLSSHRCS